MFFQDALWVEGKKPRLYSVLRLSHKTTSQFVILPRSASLMVNLHRTLFPFQWCNITFLVPPESLGSATKTKNPHVVSAVLGTRQSRAADTSKQRLNWRCYFGRVLSRVNLLHLPERGWECTAAGLTENSSWERHYCNETNSAEGKRRSGCVQIRFRQVTNWLH